MATDLNNEEDAFDSDFVDVLAPPQAAAPVAAEGKLPKDFAGLPEAVRPYGLHVVNHTPTHWQLVNAAGQPIVDVWATTHRYRMLTAVPGTKSRGGGPAEILRDVKALAASNRNAKPKAPAKETRDVEMRLPAGQVMQLEQFEQRYRVEAQRQADHIAQVVSTSLAESIGRLIEGLERKYPPTPNFIAVPELPTPKPTPPTDTDWFGDPDEPEPEPISAELQTTASPFDDPVYLVALHALIMRAKELDVGKIHAAAVDFASRSNV